MIYFLLCRIWHRDLLWERYFKSYTLSNVHFPCLHHFSYLPQKLTMEKHGNSSVRGRRATQNGRSSTPHSTGNDSRNDVAASSSNQRTVLTSSRNSGDHRHSQSSDVSVQLWLKSDVFTFQLCKLHKKLTQQEWENCFLDGRGTASLGFHGPKGERTHSP